MRAQDLITLVGIGVGFITVVVALIILLVVIFHDADGNSTTERNT